MNQAKVRRSAETPLRGVVAALALVVMTFAARAQTNAGLTAVVVPGYTFSQGEIPTTSKLNELGNPSIQIIGSVGGSNGLAANSVNGTMLYSGVVDGTTMAFNGASPRQLEVAPAGVGATQLATNAAGAGLSGGAGSALAVQVDNTNVTINAGNLLTLASNVWGWATNSLFGCRQSGTNGPIAVQAPLLITNNSLVLTNYTSPLVSGLGAAFTTNFAHGLANGTPRLVRWVLVCGTADQGFSAGDELPATAWTYRFSSAGTIYEYPLCQGGANSSNVWVTSFGLIGNDSIIFQNKTNSARVSPNTNNWSLKCYAFQ
jgi:hypothetical protein